MVRFLPFILLVSCKQIPKETKIVVSIKNQRASLVDITTNRKIKQYLVSTGRGGIGNKPGSWATPLGKCKIIDEIGENMPITTGFKARKPTRNINSNDPIVGRILQLEGLEASNSLVKRRLIYVHGTPFVDKIGCAVSMGCIRMKPEDIAEVCNYVKTGNFVEITE